MPPFLPSVGLNVSAQGNYTEPTGTTQQYTIEPSISWEVPLFGTLRSANRAAKAALYSSEWGYRGVMLSLTAEVATSYFTVLQYTRDLRIARQSYVLRRESAALVDSLARYGMSNGVALQQAMSLVYQAEADIPQYQRAVEQSRLALCVLLGENPSYFGDETFDDALLDNYQVMDIPVGLLRNCSSGVPTSWRLRSTWMSGRERGACPQQAFSVDYADRSRGYRFQFDRRYFRRSFVGVVGRRVARAADL